MKKAFDNYTFLAGGSTGKGSLWLGPDHLLVVEGQGWLIPYAEVYRRIDFDKVQAITLVATQTHIWASVGFGAAALIFGLLAFLTNAEPFIFAMLLAPTLMFGALLLVNLVRGGTCRCSLQTAVQVLRLKPLVRTRIARSVVQELATLCQKHQGGAANLQSHATGPLPANFGTAPPMPEDLAGSKLPWVGSTWSFVAGWVLVVWGLVLAGELFVPGLLYSALDAFLGATSFILAILAIARTRKFRVPGLVQLSLWSSLVLTILAGLGLYVVAVAGIVQTTANDPNAAFNRSAAQEERVLAAFADFSMEQSQHWGWALVGVAALILLCGLTIVVVGGRSRKSELAKPGASVVPPPLASPPESTSAPASTDLP